MTLKTMKVGLVALVAGCLLWAQAPTPSATVAQDPTTGIVTAVVSTSKANRVVCKYAPTPAPPAVITSLNINCTVNSQPSAAYYIQFSHPFQKGVQAATFGINANGNMNVLAIFQPVAAVPPGTATNHVNYQIAANNTLLTGSF